MEQQVQTPLNAGQNQFDDAKIAVAGNNVRQL